MELENAVIVVLGGAGLLGGCIAEAVAEAGGRPVLADISRERAEAMADRLAAAGRPRPLAMVSDLTDAASLRESIARTVAAHGRVDGVVVAAYPRAPGYGARFEDVTHEQFCQNVNLHLGGYFLACQQYCEHFKTAGGGVALMLSSIYGVVAPRFEIYEGLPMTMPVEYAAIKAGIQHLARYAAKYYKGFGIRVNCLAPGGILDGQPAPFLQAYNAHGMGKGMLEARDIAGAAIFLLSAASRHVNGQTLVVDDGWTL